MELTDTVDVPLSNGDNVGDGVDVRDEDTEAVTVVLPVADAEGVAELVPEGVALGDASRIDTTEPFAAK